MQTRPLAVNFMPQFSVELVAQIGKGGLAAQGKAIRRQWLRDAFRRAVK